MNKPWSSAQCPDNYSQIPKAVGTPAKTGQKLPQPLSQPLDSPGTV